MFQDSLLKAMAPLDTAFVIALPASPALDVILGVVDEDDEVEVLVFVPVQIANYKSYRNSLETRSYGFIPSCRYDVYRYI